MIVDESGALLLQLHHLEGDEHAVGAIDDGAERGAGVMLCVEVADVHAAHTRAVTMGADVRSEPEFIELAGHTEFVVRDPDGYSVAVLTSAR